MSLFSPKKDDTASAARPRRTRQRWTTRQKLRAAARVGDAAVTTVEDVVLLVLKVIVSALLVVITASMLFACIFAYYVKNNLSTDLNITLSDYTVSLSSTIWAYDKNGGKVPVWRCVNRLKNGKKFCKCSPTVYEDRLHKAVIEAINQVLYIRN